MKLVDEKQSVIADFQDRPNSENKIGVIEIMKLVVVDDAFLNDIVISRIAMLSEERRGLIAVPLAVDEAYGGMWDGQRIWVFAKWD